MNLYSVETHNNENKLCENLSNIIKFTPVTISMKIIRCLNRLQVVCEKTGLKLSILVDGMQNIDKRQKVTTSYIQNGYLVIFRTCKTDIPVSRY